jgi:GTP cyclohydrolase II
MKKDYREYSAIKDILKILGIDPKFVLLTNNPDKI